MVKLPDSDLTVLGGKMRQLLDQSQEPIGRHGPITEVEWQIEQSMVLLSRFEGKSSDLGSKEADMAPFPGQ